ncbi:MAG TPA: carbohydrate ABC transporter permease [Rectinemataceae bacterium]|nr:carbohydrate ABC transporter permease [Rectinemataceae bacterium]
MKNSSKTVLRFGVLAILAALMFSPLVWAFLASFRPPEDSFASGNVFFGSHLSLDNYRKALSLAPFARYFLNTFWQVLAIIGAQLFTASLAAFALARWRFAGDKLIFTIILLQMMIPTAALLVQNFSTIRFLGLYNTIPGIAMPFFGSAFATFLLRQSFLGLPRDLADAAEIDGCRWDQELRHLYLPTAKPALAAIVMSSLSFHWNDFLWPLVITQSDTVRPLTAGLVRFTQMGEIGARWGLLSAATMIVTVPLFLLFLIFQRQFVQGYLASGIK